MSTKNNKVYNNNFGPSGNVRFILFLILVYPVMLD